MAMTLILHSGQRKRDLLHLLRLREGTRCRPGWMQNRCLFRQSEARLSEIRSTKSQGKRAVHRIINQNQESELQIKQRARQNKKSVSKGRMSRGD